MIAVVTDSSSDLPPEVAASHDVGVVPLTVRFGDEVLTDRVELDTPTFWSRLATSEHLPETAAPSPGAFMETFAGLGPVEGIVCICISSELSGTYQAALLAAEQSSVPVRVIDSRVVSMALGLATLAASDVAQSGGTLEEVAAAGHGATRRANVFAALDIKPIITLNDGVVAAAGRVRTRSKAVTTVAAHVAGKDLSHLALIHSGGVGVSDLAASLLTHRDTIVAELGPVVGTHTGPGVIGVAYVEN
ncbi:DegV family protein [soil metagenome]